MASSKDVASRLNNLRREYDWSERADGIEDFLADYFGIDCNDSGVYKSIFLL